MRFVYCCGVSCMVGLPPGLHSPAAHSPGGRWQACRNSLPASTAVMACKVSAAGCLVRDFTLECAGNPQRSRSGARDGEGEANSAMWKTCWQAIFFLLGFLSGLAVTQGMLLDDIYAQDRAQGR